MRRLIRVTEGRHAVRDAHVLVIKEKEKRTQGRIETRCTNHLELGCDIERLEFAEEHGSAGRQGESIGHAHGNERKNDEVGARIRFTSVQRPPGRREEQSGEIGILPPVLAVHHPAFRQVEFPDLGGLYLHADPCGGDEDRRRPVDLHHLGDDLDAIDEDEVVERFPRCRELLGLITTSW